MKFIIIALIILLAQAETPEECVRANCPDQVKSCETNALCKMAAMKCYNSCGGSFDDVQCLSNCAKASQNAKLINLYECAEEKCPATPTSYWDCSSTCLYKLQSECFSNGVADDSVNCTLQFFDKYQECECMKKLL